MPLVATNNALERLSARGEITLANVGPFTEASDIYTVGGLQVRQQHRFQRDHLELSLINTAGGLTGGDTLAWSVSAGPNACVTLSAPAAEKIYRAHTGFASVDLNIKVEAGASLAWLPQETIAFEGSVFNRNSIFQTVKSARLLVSETVVLGRQASGETLKAFDFQDRWKVYCGNRLIHREDLVMNDKIHGLLNGAAGLNAETAITTILYVAEDALEQAEPIRKTMQAIHPSVTLGCSGIQVGETKKLICRFLAPDHYDVKPKLAEILRRLNNQHMPKSWAI